MYKDDYDPQLNREQSAVDLLDNKAKLSLYKKSSESGIPVNVLEEVFMRGYASWDGDFSRNPIQVAFNRVNSFIAGGYASQLDEDLKEACWKGYDQYGMKNKNGKKVPNCVPVKEAVAYVPPPVEAKPVPSQIRPVGQTQTGLNQAGNVRYTASRVTPQGQRSMRSGSTNARTTMGNAGQLKPTSVSTRTPTSYSASRTVPTPDSRLGSGGGSMKPTSVKTNTPTYSQGGRVKMADGLSNMTRGMSQKAVATGERSIGQSVAARLGGAAGRVAGAMAGPAGAAVGAAAPVLGDKMRQSYKTGHETLRPQQGSGGENVSAVFNRMRNSQKAQGRSVDDYEKQVLTPKEYEKPVTSQVAAQDKPVDKVIVPAPAPPTRPKYMSRGEAFKAANKEGGDNARFTYGDKDYQANREGKPYVSRSKQIPTSVREELEEATYQGRHVELNKPMQGDVKKSKVYVKDPSTGNVKKVNFGDKTLSIKKNQPDRKKSYCARSSGQGNTTDKTSANYWSRKAWDCSEETIREDSSSISDAADRRKYIALRNMEADNFKKAKASSSPLKKDHHIKMANQHNDAANEIMDKYRSKIEERVDLKKAAKVAGVVASMAYDAHHLHKHPHDVGYAAPAAVSYLAPGAKVAGSMIPAALKVDRANAGEDEKARQKKYSKLKEESKLLNKPTLSPSEIAKKFDVPEKKVVRAVTQGTKVEREHTKSSKLAREIARDHLGERPDYYKKLAQLEKSPVREEELPATKRRLADGTPERTDWLKSITPGQGSQSTKTLKKVVKESIDKA